jgi:hypothetical protein
MSPPVVSEKQVEECTDQVDPQVSTIPGESLEHRAVAPALSLKTRRNDAEDRMSLNSRHTGGASHVLVFGILKIHQSKRKITPP